MTSTVIHLTHSVDRDLINRLFAKLADKYGKLWTTRLGENGDWQRCADDWLQELSKFTLEQVRAATNKAFLIYRDFPPTQGQLIDLCLAESGVPDADQAISMMVRRDFAHPLVKMLHDKIGSWKVKNGKEEEVKKEAKQYYKICLADFYANPAPFWAILEEFNKNHSKLLPSEKNLTKRQYRGFSERMAEYQEKISSSTASCIGKCYQEFEKNKITPSHFEFDAEIYAKFKAYLLSIPESDVMILPVEYLYERMRFMAEAENPRLMKEKGYVLPEQRQTFAPDTERRNGKPTRVYRQYE